MNIEFAKQLMRTLGIPLQKAIELIQRQGEDITLCQKALYDEQVQEIIYQTGCSQNQAEEYLKKFSDPQKAIAKLNSEVHIVSVAGLSYNEPYGFQMWAEKNETMCKGKQYCIFVPFSHFERYILSDIQAIDDEFDILGTNFLDKVTVEVLMDTLKNKNLHSIEEQEFIHKIIVWLLEKLTVADTIVINGTL